MVFRSPLETQMKYMFLIYNDEKKLAALSPEENAQLWKDYGAFNEALAKAGISTPGAGLQPSSTGTTVRVAGGKTDVLDGPYADTKEQFAGYMMLETDTLEEAVAWAARSPSARYGAIELRPLHVPGTAWK